MHLVVKRGGWGDEFSLRFNIFLLHGLLGVFQWWVVTVSTVRGSCTPVLLHQRLRRCTPHLWKLLLLFTAPSGWVADGYPSYSLVSRIEFLFISCCLLRGVPVVAGGGYYIVCVMSHVGNLRLVNSLLLIILLLPPPCSLRNPLCPRFLFADSSVTCYCNWLSCFHSLTVSCPSGLCLSASLPLVTSQARLESDVHGPHPGSTDGYHHQSQALGGPDRCPVIPSVAR